MKLSRRKQEIENLRASDPLAQIMERQDIDYGSEELPTSRLVSAIEKPPDIRPAASDCCPDWEPQMVMLTDPIVLAQARNPHLTETPEYQFKPFTYCPWCGARRPE